MAEVGLYEAMSTLRAVRRLRPDPVDEATIQRVVEAASWAPTGGNAQPWRVIVVRDPAKLERLGALYSAGWSRYAAGHRELWAKAPPDEVARAERMMEAGDQLARNFGALPALLVFCFDARRMAITDEGLDRVSVVGGASIYTAVQNALLACRAEGLGCVLTTLLCQDEPAVRELLEIPAPWATAAHVPIGWPERGGHGPIRRRPVSRLAFSDTWGAPFGSEPDRSD